MWVVWSCLQDCILEQPATGQLADNHDIISLKFYETEIPVSSDSEGVDEDRTKIVPFASGAEPFRERVEDVQGSFSSKTVKVLSWLFWFALVAVCVVGVSIYVYQKRQEDSRKRFYWVAMNAGLRTTAFHLLQNSKLKAGFVRRLQFLKYYGILPKP